MDKQALRRMITAQKQQLSQQQIAAYSRQLQQMFLQHPAYAAANSIYGYLNFNQEVQTVPLLRQAQKDGKRVAVPKITGKQMRFLWLDDLTAVAPNSRGIPEPTADGPLANDSTALVLVPGLAFDAAGHRVGYGGGFYDRFFAAEPRHYKLALCYPFQLFDRLEHAPHDIPADEVLCARAVGFSEVHAQQTP